MVAIAERPERSPLFNDSGQYIGPPIPDECVRDCTVPGRDASDAITHWQAALDFNVPHGLAIAYLREFGAWREIDLMYMSDVKLARRILWLACYDVRDSGEWLGLVR